MSMFPLWVLDDNWAYVLFFRFSLTKSLSVQLGPNHVCVILSHRRDSITSAWYYVSRRRDTSFEARFRHRNKYLADVLSLDPCKTVCIHSKIPFQIIFGAKIFSYFFLNLEYLKCIKYHVSVILTQRQKTLAHHFYKQNFSVFLWLRRSCFLWGLDDNWA